MSELKGYGVEVKLVSDFLVIKETLERIGIANRKTCVITPSVYILHKQGTYYIIHFKELLALDGFKRDINETDICRRNAIISLLFNWGMITIVEADGIYQKELEEQIFVLPYSEKSNYRINHKYRISRRRGNG
jgi:hypothetical protein